MAPYGISKTQKIIIMNQQKQNYALPITMMIALFFMISFVTGLQNPLGVIVKNQFDGISNIMSQMGNAANFIAYFFMGIPSGLLIQRYGYKKTALGAIAVGFAGVSMTFFAGQAASFPIYLIGAFISGFSMCMLNAVVNPMLNTLGGGGNKGNQLIQVGGSVNSIGATLAPVLGGAIMGNVANSKLADSTPILFIAMGIFLMTFIVLYFVTIPEPHGAGQKRVKANDKHSPLSFRHFIFGIIGIFLYVGIEVGIANITNLYMTAQTTEMAQENIAAYEKQAKDAAYLEQVTQEDLANKDNSAYVSKVISANAYDNAQKILRNEAKPGLGLTAATAGIIIGTYWLLMMVGRLFGAAFGAKVSSKSMLLFAASLGILFILLAIFLPQTEVSMPVFKSNLSFGLAQVPVNVFFLALCGLCTSVMWGGIFNLAVEGLGKYTAAASGIFMVMVCGGGLLPLVQAGVADLFGYMASYWVIIAALAYLVFYALIGSKNVNKDIEVE